MIRERELLKRTMDFLECFVFYSEGLELREAIRDFLSTPEPEQDEEPVAWTNRQEINALNEECTVYMYAEPMEGEDNIPLFLHPAQRPDFVRLSEEEVTEILTSAYDMYSAICAVENMLVRKNIINKSDPDSVDLQSRCRGDKL